MVSIKIQDIRVLPGSLDLKNNAGKSLSEILGQLQSGTIVKGLVVGTTPKGEVIFHTAHGRFAAKNVINLVRGDTISLKLVHENNNLSGTIISVNDKKRDNEGPVKLGLSQESEKIKSVLSSEKTSNAVSFINNSNIPKVINGEISYLNLSKMDKNTPLFQVLNTIPTEGNNKINISLNVVSNKQASFPAFIALGEISGNTRDGNQLIKTDFGVILSKNTNMSIGQKLILEITSVNNQSLVNSVNKSVSDLLFLANKNWSLLKSLAQTVHGNNSLQGRSATVSSDARGILQANITNSDIASSVRLPSNSASINLQNANQSANISKTEVSEEQLVNKAMTKTTYTEIKEFIANTDKLQTLVPKNIKSRIRNSDSIREEIKLSKKTSAQPIDNTDVQRGSERSKVSINSIIKDIGQREEIRKLSSELTNLKELILPSIKEENNLEKWQTVFIPFYNGKNVENQEIKIQRSQGRFLKFTIDVNLLDNPMQINGLVKFASDNKTPQTFDLIIRSKESLDPYIKNYIADIYQLNQNISGVLGTLAIEQKTF
ncbi:MAG: hypothetical protein NWP47_04935 [Rickettsiaceae bacterium]|nr:hypothetical protein [Rickettsiaceae bacterium]